MHTVGIANILIGMSKLIAIRLLERRRVARLHILGGKIFPDPFPIGTVHTQPHLATARESLVWSEQAPLANVGFLATRGRWVLHHIARLRLLALAQRVLPATVVDLAKHLVR